MFEQSSYIPASFSDGRICLRDLETIAAIRVAAGSTVLLAATDDGLERELLGAFGEWVAEADDKTELIEELYAEHETFPVVEDGGLVHFVYRGQVDDIALAGLFLATSEQIPMDRIAGTDVYFKSLQLDPKSIWEYCFDVDLGTPTPAPRNPHMIGTFFGPGSELRMTDWPAPDYLPGVEEDEKAAPESRIHAFEFRSDIRDSTSRIRVYLPPGYAAGPDRYPLLVMHYVRFGLEVAGLDQVLDYMIAQRTAPLIAVLLP